MNDSDREKIADALGEEHVKHTEWWSAEMDYCRSKLAPLLTRVDADDRMELQQHGTSVNSDGEHKVRMTFVVEGEPWEDDGE